METKGSHIATKRDSNFALVREFEKISFTLKTKVEMSNQVEGQSVSTNDAKPVLAAVPLDGDGQRLHDGDRVYSYGYNKDMKPERLYGTLYKNEDYPEVSEWYIAYDDGEECAVLELSLVFKA